MKKTNKILLIFLFSLIILSGCTKQNESGSTVDSKTDLSDKKGTLICTRSASAPNNTTVDLKYEVSYKAGNVTNLHSTEKIVSNDEETLDSYEVAYKNIFKIYEDLKYYDNTVTRSSNSVVSDTVIQYNKVDLEKLKELENAEESVIKDGKVAIKDWLAFAEKFGTKCSEK